jgi:hypothetical protein
MKSPHASSSERCAQLQETDVQTIKSQNMKEYRFSEENAKKTIKSQTISRIPMILIAVLGGLYIANSQNGGAIFENSLVLILTLSLSAVAVTIGLLIGIKNGAKTLMQNTYRISENGIERATPSGKSVNIDFDKIDLHKSLKKGLFIKAQNQKILIPAGLDGYDEITNLILEKVK